MKFVNVLAAASLALAPMVAAAQDSGPLVGVPPDEAVSELGPIPEGTAAGGAALLVLIGAGVGIGLGSGGGGDGTPGTTGTTSTTSTTSSIVQ